MKYIITRLDYNNVKAEVEGYYPLKGTFEGFFKDLRSYINRPGFVNNLEYKNHTIYMEKLDQEAYFLYTDQYVLDGLLETDARFMELLNALLSEYEAKKEKNKMDVLEKIEKRKIQDKSLRTAIKIYINYSTSGEIEVIEDSQIAANVIKLFKQGNPLVYTSISTTLDGYVTTSPQVDFKTPRIKSMNAATGVTGVATVALAITSLIVPNPITILTGAATGIGCYCANKRKYSLNIKEAKKVLSKLATIYEEMYPQEAEQKTEKSLVKSKNQEN